MSTIVPARRKPALVAIHRGGEGRTISLQIPGAPREFVDVVSGRRATFGGASTLELPPSSAAVWVPR